MHWMRETKFKFYCASDYLGGYARSHARPSELSSSCDTLQLRASHNGASTGTAGSNAKLTSKQMTKIIEVARQDPLRATLQAR